MASRVISAVTPQDRDIPVGDWYEKAIEDFFSTAESAGITHWREVGRPQSSMDQLREQLEAAIEKNEEQQA
jgi:hypothetical protein